MPYEIRCKCGFLIGFSETEVSGNITCIYCKSETDFFRAIFNGNEETFPGYIYATLDTDKSHYRRGLMHDRKNAMKLWHELCDEITPEFIKEFANEP